MKKITVFIMVSSLLYLTNCKKKEIVESVDNSQTTASVENTTPLVNEETMYAMYLFSSEPNMRSEGKPKSKPCGAEIDVVDSLPTSVSKKNRIVRMTYDGKIECFKNSQPIKKQGFIQFQLIDGNSWDEAGAVIRVTYSEYKEYKSTCSKCTDDDVLYSLNGSETFKNVSGGFVEQAYIDSVLIHEIKSTNMTLTYGPKNIRVQNVSQIMTAKKVSDKEYVFSLTGTGNHDGKTNVAMWGTINGRPYHMIYNTPKTYNTCDGKGKLVSGEAYYKKGSDQIIETFGVNEAGLQVNDCSAYGYKSVKTEANGTVTTVLCKY